MKRAYFNWSGGKDSAFALWTVLQEKQYQVDYLLTSINAAYDRISMHGVRRSLLEKQVEGIGIPLTTIELPEQPSMEEYEAAMRERVEWLVDRGMEASIFGDIFLEDLRKYREDQLQALGMECVFPIWKRSSSELAHQFIQAGFQSIIVCVNEKYVGKEFCGRLFNEEFINDLPAGVDPCGENGEFHSFVFDGPLFSTPIEFEKGEIVYRQYKGGEGFFFCDLGDSGAV